MGHRGIRIACFLLLAEALGAPRTANAQAGDQYIRSFYTKQLDQAINAQPNEGLSVQLQQLRTKIQDKNLPVTSLLPEADKLLELVRTTQKGARASTPGMRKQATDATERFMKWLDDLVKVNSATEDKIRNQIAKLQLFESANEKGQVDPNAMKQLKEFLRTVLPAEDVAKLEQPGILEQLAQAAVNAEDNPPALYAAAGGAGGGRGLAARSGGAGGNKDADANAAGGANAASGSAKDANASKGLVDMGPLEKPNTNKSLNPNLGALGDTPPLNQVPPDLGGGDSSYPDSIASSPSVNSGNGGGTSGSPTTSGTADGQKQASAQNNPDVVSKNSGNSAGGASQGAPTTNGQRSQFNPHNGVTAPVEYGVVVPQNTNQMQTRNATPQATAQRTNTIKSNVPSRNYSQEEVARAYRDQEYWKTIARNSPPGNIRKNAENMLAYSQGVISKASPGIKNLAEADLRKNSVPGPGGLQCYQYGTPSPSSAYGCKVDDKKFEQLVFEIEQRGLHFKAIAQDIFEGPKASSFTKDYLNLPEPSAIKCVNGQIVTPENLKHSNSLFNAQALPTNGAASSINDLNLVRLGMSRYANRGVRPTEVYVGCKEALQGKKCGSFSIAACDGLVEQFYLVSGRSATKPKISNSTFPFVTKEPLLECNGLCQAGSLLTKVLARVHRNASACGTPTAAAVSDLINSGACLSSTAKDAIRLNSYLDTNLTKKASNSQAGRSPNNSTEGQNIKELLYSVSGNATIESRDNFCQASDGALKYLANLISNPAKAETGAIESRTSKTSYAYCSNSVEKSETVKGH